MKGEGVEKIANRNIKSQKKKKRCLAETSIFFKRERYDDVTTTRRSPDPTRRRSQMRPYVPGTVVDLHFRRIGRQSPVLPAPPGAQKQTNVYIYFSATQPGRF